MPAAAGEAGCTDLSRACGAGVEVRTLDERLRTQLSTVDAPTVNNEQFEEQPAPHRRMSVVAVDPQLVAPSSTPAAGQPTPKSYRAFQRAALLGENYRETPMLTLDELEDIAGSAAIELEQAEDTRRARQSTRVRRSASALAFHPKPQPPQPSPYSLHIIRFAVAARLGALQQLCSAPHTIWTKLTCLAHLSQLRAPTSTKTAPMVEAQVHMVHRRPRLLSLVG